VTKRRRPPRPDVEDAEVVEGSPIKLPAPIRIERFQSNQQKCEEYGFEQMLSDVQDGILAAPLARKVGVTVEALIRWIDRDYDRHRRWEWARRAAAETFAQRALEVIECIPEKATAGQIVRARETAHHYRWLAKMLDPQTFGDKQEVTVKAPASSLDTQALKAEIAQLLGSVSGFLPKGDT
jgi:hypothetical protein